MHCLSVLQGNDTQHAVTKLGNDSSEPDPAIRLNDPS